MRRHFIQLATLAAVAMGSVALGFADEAKPAAPAPAVSYPAPAPAPDWQAALAASDAGRGRAIMQAGLDRGQVPACTSCHGVNGEPVAGSNIPRLSGQSAYYLAKQLADYADGARRNAMMTQYARLLTVQQRADVAVA